jgi:hypothetical protein
MVSWIVLAVLSRPMHVVHTELYTNAKTKNDKRLTAIAPT